MFLIWLLIIAIMASSFYAIVKIYDHKSKYDITFTISPDLYDVLDGLAGEDETVEEYIGRLCQEIAETEWYVNQAQRTEEDTCEQIKE
jgi:hypothetical protein